MTEPCPTCGHQLAHVIVWDGLNASDSPYTIFWHGRRLPLTPIDARIAFQMVLNKSVSDDFILSFSNANAGTSMAKTRAPRLRKAFNDAGVPLKITRLGSYGYRLEKA